MQPDPKKAKAAINDQIKDYRQLQAVTDEEAFKAYFDMLIKNVAIKMMWCFEADNIKNWDDFCKAKGEIVARLQPIQEVYGAQFMIDQLELQLEAYKGDS